MQVNYKLKCAVATALAVFSLGLQQQALALGLGEIHVQSHLGQPFRANIKVLDAADLESANIESCFKLAESDNGGNALTKANFKLGALSGNDAMLSVTTSQIMNEPILNMVLIAECGNSVQRDYVVLLDPLLSAEAETVTNDEAIVALEAPVAVAKKAKHQHAQVIVSSNDDKPKYNKKHSKNKNLNPNNSNIILHIPGGSAETQIKVTEEKSATSTPQPRLSISGGKFASESINATNLRLDRQLTFTPDANTQPIRDEDIQDEVTAMNNRLAHLSVQLAKLENRNLLLESDNKFKTQQLSEVDSFKAKLRWMGYLLSVALVLVSSHVAAKWWRRKQPQKLSANAIWASNDNIENVNASEDDEIYSFDNVSQKADDTVNKSTDSAQSFAADLTNEDHIVVEETFDLTILDHADVYLSHGRTALAIQLLQNHLLDHPKQSVTIWLFLLDLLEKEKMQAVYEQTALECKEHFNIRIAAFSNDQASVKQHLEDFPRLLSGLEQAWGTPAALVYLDDLIYNSRLETRVGFEKSVLEELLMLKDIAKQELNSAEVIQLDEKKLELKEQKEALLQTKKTEKLNQLAQAEALKVAETEAQNKADRTETNFDFKLIEYN